jgi:hypothetical protein
MRINFETTGPNQLEWFDLGPDGRVIDTSKENEVDEYFRGAELRGVEVGKPFEFHWTNHGDDEWHWFGLNVKSIDP